MNRHIAYRDSENTRLEILKETFPTVLGGGGKVHHFHRVNGQ